MLNTQFGLFKCQDFSLIILKVLSLKKKKSVEVVGWTKGNLKHKMSIVFYMEEETSKKKAEYVCCCVALTLEHELCFQVTLGYVRVFSRMDTSVL